MIKVIKKHQGLICKCWACPEIRGLPRAFLSLKAQYYLFPAIKAGRDLLQRRCNKECNKEIYDKYR